MASKNSSNVVPETQNEYDGGAAQPDPEQYFHDVQERLNEDVQCEIHFTFIRPKST